MMHTPRFALIGCGHIAARHLQQIERVGQLMAVCDIHPEKAQALAGENIPVFASLEQLLQAALPIDIAVIATPNGYHAEQAIACLQAGYHVLIEKPMAISSADAEMMLAAAMRVGKQVWVVKQNRFNPPVQQVKQWLQEGSLGDVLQFQLNAIWCRDAAYYTQDAWRGSAVLDGGILYTQFSHFIDILLWLLGDMQVLSGYRTNTQHQGLIAFEDQGQVLLKAASGAHGVMQYSINAVQRNAEGSLAIYGTKGMVKIGGQYLNTIDWAVIDGKEIQYANASAPNHQYGFYEGSMSHHDQVYDSVLASWQGNPGVVLSNQDAIKTVSLIEQIMQQIPLQ
jgi:predicted dehydrogenase